MHAWCICESEASSSRTRTDRRPRIRRHRYNEAIIEGGASWNQALPGAVAAFFYDKTRKHEGGKGGAPSFIRRKRDGFIGHWGLKEEDAPLLEFDRADFARPFTTVD